MEVSFHGVSVSTQSWERVMHLNEWKSLGLKRILSKKSQNNERGGWKSTLEKNNLSHHRK